MELLGVYFGSFDPLHENHIAVSNFAMTHGYCSAVVLVANGDNPLKPDIAPCALRQRLIGTRLSQEDRGGGAAGAEWADRHQQDWWEWDLQDWWWHSSRIAQYRCDRHEQARMGWKERLWLCDKLSKQFGFSGGADSTIQLMGEDSFLQAVHNAGDSLKFARGRKLLIFPRTSSGTSASSLRETLRGLSGVGDGSTARHISIASDYVDPFLGLSSTGIRAALSDEGASPGPPAAPTGLHPAVYAKLRELRMYGTAPLTIPILYFTGRPGSGKSTTARRLAEDLRLGYFSSGDVFRSLVGASKGAKGGGGKGKKRAVTKEVATARVLEELESFLMENKRCGRGVVLDCQPREDADNCGEREVLLRTGLQINLLVNLVCTAEVAARRISERGVRPGEDSTIGKGSQKGQRHANPVGEKLQERASWDFEAPVQRLIAEAFQANPSAVLELDVNSDDREAIYSSFRRRAQAALHAVVQDKNQKGFLPPGPSCIKRFCRSAAPLIDSVAPGQEVSHHYDLAAQAYGDQKKSAGDASAKHFFYNNWVKSCLIALGLDAAAAAQSGATRAAEAPPGSGPRRRICILDLGCGRGGDVGKWTAAFLGLISQEELKSVEWSLHYLGLDLSADAIATAKQRWSGVQKSGLMQQSIANRENIHFDFQVADFTVFEDAQKAIEPWVQRQQLPSLSCFQLISSQMALHYSFESRAKASSFARICREYACSDAAGAVLLGTTVDSDVVRSRCCHTACAEKGGSSWAGNSLYRIEFLPPLPASAETCASYSPLDGVESSQDESNFGQSYRFSLAGAIDNCREFLVNPAVLKDLFVGGEDGSQPNPKGLASTGSTCGSRDAHSAPRAIVSTENFLVFGEQVLRGEADPADRLPHPPTHTPPTHTPPTDPPTPHRPGPNERPAQRSNTFQFFSSASASRLRRRFRSLAQGPNYRLLTSGDDVAGPQVFDLGGDAREVCELYRILLLRFQGMRRQSAEEEADEGGQRLHAEEARSSAARPHHGGAVPCTAGERSQPSGGRTFFKAQDYSHVIVRHPLSGKYLAVEETWNRGWFIPAGCLDPGETYRDAAIRETLEETGVEIVLKGILGLQRGLTSSTGTRRKVVFYAEPTPEWLAKQDGEVTKARADEHSLQARWMTCQEFAQLKHIRSHDLLVWGEYIETGKQIYPLDLLDECTLVKRGGGVYGREGDRLGAR